jgi:hypothetical protein
MFIETTSKNIFWAPLGAECFDSEYSDGAPKRSAKHIIGTRSYKHLAALRPELQLTS